MTDRTGRQLPCLRHHAARRRAARGHQPHRRRQADDRPAPGRLRRGLHRGRLARRQPAGHRVLRPRPPRRSTSSTPSSSPSAPPAGRAPRPPRTRRSRRCWSRAPRSSPWSPSRTTGMSNWRCAPRWRRTWRWSATPSPTCASRAAASSSTASTSSTATSANPEYAKRGRAAPRTRPAPTSSCSATPTAACCPPRSRPSSRTVLADTGARLGIHAQDDTGCAVANTLAAVDAGATHVQCTANGYGERVGNANLFPVVAALELKYGKQVLPEGALREMTRISHAIAEVVNLAPSTHQPYVGVSAFAHKAGPARLRDQGRPGPLPAHRPRTGRQHHADARLRHGRPRLHRAQGQGARHRPRRRPRAGRPGRGAGQGARAQGLHLRGRRRLLRAAAARRGRGPGPRATSAPSPGAPSSRTAPTAPTPTRRRSSSGPRASASSPPPRATARSTRWTGRCASPWSGSTRSSPSWSWSTTRSASWRARTAPSPPPGC